MTNSDKMIVNILLVLVSMRATILAKYLNWNYKEQEKWPVDCSGGTRQSPINIDTLNVQYKPELSLQLVDYDRQVSFTYKNVEHTVTLSVWPSHTEARPAVRFDWTGQGKSGEFELDKIHLHWGRDIKSGGSEHTLDNQRFAAEMHLVHILRGLNRSRIAETPDCLLVLGVLIEPDWLNHHKMEDILVKMSYVNGTHSEYVDHSSATLISLLPANYRKFYAYNGSLTTPPCSEVVTWIIFGDPVYVQAVWLEQLTSLQELQQPKRPVKMGPNFHHLQALADRQVFSSFEPWQARPLLARTLESLNLVRLREKLAASLTS